MVTASAGRVTGILIRAQLICAQSLATTSREDVSEKLAIYLGYHLRWIMCEWHGQHQVTVHPNDHVHTLQSHEDRATLIDMCAPHAPECKERRSRTCT